MQISFHYVVNDFFIQIYMDTHVEDEVRHKYENSIRLILSECEDFATLEKLLRLSSTHFEIMSRILEKLSKVFIFIFINVFCKILKVNVGRC